MITRLQSRYKYRRRYFRSYPEYVNAGRFWTDEQIQRAFRLTPERFDACVAAYRATKSHSHWDHTKIVKAYTEFVQREQRWPTSPDWKNWRENGLPARSSAAWHGLTVGELALFYANKQTKLHKAFTAQMVLSVPNLTARRNAITRIGIDKIISKGGGKQIQQDDFGTLWKLPTDSPDPFTLFVEVVNSSPRINEKTGKVVLDRRGNPVYDHYYLRVPHNCRTAREAVAWTFEREPTSFAGFAAES